MRKTVDNKFEHCQFFSYFIHIIPEELDVCFNTPLKSSRKSWCLFLSLFILNLNAQNLIFGTLK